MRQTKMHAFCFFTRADVAIFDGCSLNSMCALHSLNLIFGLKFVAVVVAAVAVVFVTFSRY